MPCILLKCWNLFDKLNLGRNDDSGGDCFAALAMTGTPRVRFARYDDFGGIASLQDASRSLRSQ
jgi:hypothetical protein